MKVPRVVFVDQTGQLGGAELCLFDQVTRFESPSTVVLFDDGPLVERLRSEGIRVVVLPLGNSAANVRKESRAIAKVLAAGDAASVARRLRREIVQHDIVFANTPKSMVVACVANIGLRRPLVYHLHDILSLDHFSATNLRLLVTAANRCAAKIIANSQATANAFVAAGGNARKVVVVPNGFDPVPFEAAYAARAYHRSSLRSELDFRDEDKLVALVGRFSEWKGQHIAIEALRELPGVHLLLVGDALFGEEEYKTRLQNLAEERGVADRVHHCGFRKNVTELMQGVDAVIHTSTVAEPFGRVIVEAMLSRIPVIATRGGGAAEIVNHGETGLLVEMGSASSLASAIREALQDADRAQGMVDKAYHVALERYDIDRVVKQVEAVIREVAGVA